MKRFSLLLATLLGAAFLLFAGSTEVARDEPGAADGKSLQLSVEPYVAGGLIANPTDITNTGDARSFVVERQGVIRVLEPRGQVRATPSP